MAEELTDDLIGEILLRLAPDDPASLVGASAVCKRWRRVASTPAFRSGFAQRHRSAPMLGFFANLRDDRDSSDDIACFVPATAFRPRCADRRGCCALDARHGRVLLHRHRGKPDLEVWDPVTDELQVLPDLDQPLSPLDWNATVLCAAAHGACDHLDCRRKPFLVVFLDVGRERMRLYVYSSEAGAWSGPTDGPCRPDYGVEMVPTALVGNALYFLIDASQSVLKYDLAARSLSVISLPLGVIPIDLPPGFIWGLGALRTTEDGRLGFARVEMSTLGLWSMEIGPDGHALWVPDRSIQLSTPPGVDGYIGFAHGVGVCFMGDEGACFSMDLKSGQVREEDCGDGYTHGVVPYSSFYTTEFRQYG